MNCTTFPGLTTPGEDVVKTFIAVSLCTVVLTLLLATGAVSSLSIEALLLIVPVTALAVAVNVTEPLWPGSSLRPVQVITLPASVPLLSALTKVRLLAKVSVITILLAAVPPTMLY